MRRTGRGVFVGLLVLALSATVQAVPTYTGSLSYVGGGIAGYENGNVNPWLAEGTVFEWAVTDNGGTYTYWYQLTVPTMGISHMTIEVSDEFVAADVISVTQGSLTEGQPDNYPQPAADIGMPDSMKGLKFEAGSSSELTWTLEFTTRRRPVWGDFFAINGKKPGETASIWNAGFTSPDSDPDDPPANGTVDNHILVPDTVIIPAPGAMLLGALGTGLVGWLRRRKTL